MLTSRHPQFPQLEKIEDEYLAIQRERYSIIAARRFADDSDDVALFTGAALPSTFRPLPPSDAPASADEDLPLAAAESPEDLEPRSVMRTTRRAERERRRVERTQLASSAYPDLVDSAGYDTDATLAAGHVSDLSAALSSLEAQLAALFADVKAADFRDPNLGIRARFEQWRERFAEEYEMTFAGLSLVQVWEFWARVEMASWNPFEVRPGVSLLGSAPLTLNCPSCRSPSSRGLRMTWQPTNGTRTSLPTATALTRAQQTTTTTRTSPTSRPRSSTRSSRPCASRASKSSRGRRTTRSAVGRRLLLFG